MKNFMAVKGGTPPKKSGYCGIFVTAVWHNFDNRFMRATSSVRSQLVSKVAVQLSRERVFQDTRFSAQYALHDVR